MSRSHHIRRAAFLTATLILTLLSFSADEKRVSIYSLIANYSLPVVERNGQDYTGLLEALEPLGAVSATSEGSHWRLRYNNQYAEFTPGSSRARVRQADFDLRANFLLENNRGLVPLTTLGPLLSRILGGPVNYHEGARRAFVGNVAVHFTAQVNKAAAHTLVMNFTAPVNPTIATEPGKLRMMFNHEPLVAPGSPSLTFDDNLIPSANFAEDNGAAEIAVNGTAALFASFSNGNRTITITPVSQLAAKPQTASVTQPASPNGTPQTAATSSPPAPASSSSEPAVKFFAVVDASHGGSERGEALTDQLAEKDVTLALTRALRQQLQARGISTLVVRDGDATLTADQRAAQANVAHPSIYISLHASSQGRGVRLYTALLPSAASDAGPFVNWDAAQASFLAVSLTAADGLAAELRKKQIAVRVLMAPLRPLNSVTAAAVAVEVAPPPEGIANVNSAAYQQLITGAIADGVLAMRSRLETGR